MTRSTNGRRLGVIIVALSMLASCSREELPGMPVTRSSPIVPLDTGTVRIVTAADSFLVSVEIAETRDQQAIGLMDRDDLPENEGMIFLYEELHDGEFYMYRTRIPLDIAFFDDSGRIVSIQTMPPCASPVARVCDTYSAGGLYRGALEVGAGYFASRGVAVGDELVLITASP